MSNKDVELNDDFDADEKKLGRAAKTPRKKFVTITEPIDYKNTTLLRQYVTERGRMIPRRVSGLSAKQQRQVAVAIRRARVLALIPYSVRGD